MTTIVWFRQDLRLADNPALVNQEPFGEGWMIKLKPARAEDVKQLLDHTQYAQHVEEQHA